MHYAARNKLITELAVVPRQFECGPQPCFLGKGGVGQCCDPG